MSQPNSLFCMYFRQLQTHQAMGLVQTANEIYLSPEHPFLRFWTRMRPVRFEPGSMIASIFVTKAGRLQAHLKFEIVDINSMRLQYFSPVRRTPKFIDVLRRVKEKSWPTEAEVLNRG